MAEKEIETTSCPHVESIGRINPENILFTLERWCDECQFNRSNRWVCLNDDCLFVGCGAKSKNHAGEHAEITHHQLQMHLRNYNIWCHECQKEVFPRNNIPRWIDGEKLLDLLPAKPPPPSSPVRKKKAEVSAKKKTQEIEQNRGQLGEYEDESIRMDDGDQKSTKTTRMVTRSSARNNDRSMDRGESIDENTMTKSSSAAAARRLIVPTPGPELISVAGDDIIIEDEKRSNTTISTRDSGLGTEKSSPANESSMAAMDSANAAVGGADGGDLDGDGLDGGGGGRTEHEEVRVRRFFISGRPYLNRERPMAVVDQPPVDFGTSAREEEPFGLTGLRNMGNTCYMNAALQALANTTPLTEYLLNCRPIAMAERHNQRSLALEYALLIAEMWNDRRPGSLVPYNLLSWVRLCHPSFRGFQQQDAQEFLRYFLDQVHEDLKQPVYPWECQGDDRSSTNSSSSSGIVRGRESTESADENGDISSSSTSSRSSGLGNGQSEDGSYRTCDSGWISDQDSSKRQRAESAPSTNSPKRKRTAVSESFASGQLAGNGSPSLSRSMNSNSYGSVASAAAAHRRSHAAAHQAAAGNSNNGTGGDSSDFSDAKQELSPSSVKRMPLPKRKALRYGSGVPRKKPIRFRSIVSDIFDGKLLSSVQCLTCNTVSETKETFQDLSIPIPGRDQVEALRTRAVAQAASAAKIAAELNNGGGSTSVVGQEPHPYSGASWWNWFLSWFSWMGGWMSAPSVTLEDCLAAFFSADDLKGDDMYSCDGCKKLRNGVKCCYLLQLPEVLCVHLKRFRHELMYSTKISTRITFPLEGLDLRPFLHRNAMVQNGEHIYDLYAVICHHGSVESGHYTAYCLNSFNGRWYEYDDQCVTEVDAYMVQSAAAAYVLFYRKRDERQQVVREETANLLRRQPDVLPQFFISQEWINRFNHMSDPGPITNFDFLCPHGCIDPKKHDFLADLYAEVPSMAWQYLYKKFGGGPVCNKLLHCVDCNQYYRRLKARRDEELETFYRIERAYKQENRADCFYAMSMKWFRKWEGFVMNRQEEPPGPVDNSDIVAKKTEKNEFVRVKQGSNHANIHRELWEFFYDRYGGGPEIVISNTWPSGRNRSQEKLDQGSSS